MKISIIIPAYNASNVIKKALDSLINQTYQPYEIIVIDDGSTDDTKNIVEKYILDTGSKIIRFYSRDNKGAMYTRKEGVNLSSGDYIMFLDSDDRLTLNCLMESVVLLKKYKPDILKFGYAKEIDSKIKYLSNYPFKNDLFYVNKFHYKQYIYPKLINTYFFNSMCFQFIKKEVFQLCKNDYSFIMGEDFRFNLDLLTNSNSILIVNEHYYIYSFNESSVTSTNDVEIRKKSINDVVDVYSSILDYLDKWDVLYLKNDVYNRILKECLLQIKFLLTTVNISYNDFKLVMEDIFPKIDFICDSNFSVSGINLILLKNKWYFILYLKYYVFYKFFYNVKQFIRKVVKI